MGTAEDLIAGIAADRDRQAAMKRLAQIGAAAVEPVFIALRTMSAPPFLLSQVLFQMEDGNAAELLISGMRDDNTMVELSSIEALGYLRVPESRQALRALLRDPEVDPTPKRVAAHALGICGMAEDLPTLVATLEAAEGDEEHELVIASAMSRARLGDHGGLSAVLALTRFKGDETIRASAIRALRFLAGPGVFRSLERALKDRQAEVRRAAVESLYYLGNRTVMENLFSASSDRDDETANNARVYLRFLIGREVDEKAIERRKWWATFGHQFDVRSCYRNGVLVSLEQFWSLLESESDVLSIARDFTIYTGEWIGSDAWIGANLEEARQRVKTAISRSRDDFQHGTLYKSGSKIDLDTLL